jgi:ABC-type branched-subunit amino acid transport system ATPase component
LVWNIESSNMSETVLSIQGLHAGYGRAEVLSGIDLSAPKGSIITVIGPNGAGKSTFLNALMGVLPSKGSIHVEGRDISQLSLEERVCSALPWCRKNANCLAPCRWKTTCCSVPSARCG